jgi:FdhD protein
MNHISSKRKIVQFQGGKLIQAEDVIAEEFPLTIFVNGEEFATMVCSPEGLEELAVGFLASEGVLRSSSELASLQIDSSKGFAYADVSGYALPSVPAHSKRFIGSCCGKSRQFYLLNDVKTAKTSTSIASLTPEECLSAMKQLQDASVDFKQTGGVHNAALFHGDRMIISRTDIGRHNALDKILGYCILNRIPVRDKAIAFSGRISSEVLLKAAKIGVGILLSKSAPTGLAIDLAEDLNITAAGFIRGNSFNIYSCPERIKET